MVKTKIRRSLFIGLGGTGMRTLLYLKKLFVDTYGEVPPMIGFLGVDTDKGEFSKTLDPKATNNVGVMSEGSVETTLFVKGTPRTTEVIKLEPSEQVRIIVERPKDIYNVRKDNFTWIPEKNLNALISLSHGAGMVRSNGRFALIANNAEIESKVKTALTKVANVTTVDNPKYELIDTDTDVYLIFSLGGGTGCGTFIDMAYLIRRCAPKSKLAGYGLLPRVFRAKFHNEMGRVMPNAFGAMQDLDWLMGRNWNTTPIQIPIQNGRHVTSQDHPFNAVIFVDNENRNKDVYADNSQLEEMIALALVTSVGELSVANTSVLDNLAVSAAGGSFDVEQKQAWASGMGVCEVLIQTEELRKIYTHSVASYLANKLLNKPTDIRTEVEAWIDNVRIREHDADHVIDSIFELTRVKNMILDKEDYKNATLPVDQYIAMQQPSQNELNENLTILIERVTDQLRDFIIRIVNRKVGHGVGAAADALEILESEVKLYLSEMNDEIVTLKDKIAQEELMVKNHINDLKSSSTGALSIFKGQEIQDTANDLSHFAKVLATDKCDLSRHQQAVVFFTDLLSKIAKQKGRIVLVKERLEQCVKNSQEAISKIKQNMDRHTETFQYDLTSYIASEVAIDKENIQFSDYIDSLNGNRIYDFADLETSTIWKTLLDYTYFLPKAEDIGNKDINEIMNAMSKDAFDELIKRVVAKASPLLPHDFHGYKTGKPAVNYYIGVSNFELSRLKKDDYFKKNIEDAADVNFSKIGMKDRLIIFSQMSPIPPFCIECMNDCKDEYQDPDQTINFHIDAEWLKMMKREGYSMYPGGTSINTLETWVKGFIFGFIKNEGGMYKYLDEENEDYFLDDYWVDLAQYRDDAFMKFDEIIAAVSVQYEKKIADMVKEHGAPYVREKIADAKKNYWEIYSQIGYSKNDLKDSHLQGTAKQIKDEIVYLKNLSFE